MTSPDQRPEEPREPAPSPLSPAAPGCAPSAPSSSERDRALAALHHMAKPQPRAPLPGEEPAPEEASNPASGPSGFVGMLSKGQGSGDTHLAAPAIRGEEGSTRSRYGLGMAREITPNAPAPGGAREQAAAVAGPRKVGAPPPRKGAYAVLLPVVVFVGLLLLFIGVWALGAVIYMNSKHEMIY